MVQGIDSQGNIVQYYLTGPADGSRTFVLPANVDLQHLARIQGVASNPEVLQNLMLPSTGDQGVENTNTSSVDMVSTEPDLIDSLVGNNEPTIPVVGLQTASSFHVDSKETIKMEAQADPVLGSEVRDPGHSLLSEDQSSEQWQQMLSNLVTPPPSAVPAVLVPTPSSEGISVQTATVLVQTPSDDSNNMLQTATLVMPSTPDNAANMQGMTVLVQQPTTGMGTSPPDLNTNPALMLATNTNKDLSQKPGEVSYLLPMDLVTNNNIVSTDNNPMLSMLPDHSSQHSGQSCSDAIISSLMPNSEQDLNEKNVSALSTTTSGITIYDTPSLSVDPKSLSALSASHPASILQRITDAAGNEQFVITSVPSTASHIDVPICSQQVSLGSISI